MGLGAETVFAGRVFQREEGGSIGHIWRRVMMHDPEVTA